MEETIPCTACGDLAKFNKKGEYYQCEICGEKQDTKEKENYNELSAENSFSKFSDEDLGFFRKSFLFKMKHLALLDNEFEEKDFIDLLFLMKSKHSENQKCFLKILAKILQRKNKIGDFFVKSLDKNLFGVILDLFSKHKTNKETFYTLLRNIKSSNVKLLSHYKEKIEQVFALLNSDKTAFEETEIKTPKSSRAKKVDRGDRGELNSRDHKKSENCAEKSRYENKSKTQYEPITPNSFRTSNSSKKDFTDEYSLSKEIQKEPTLRDVLRNKNDNSIESLSIDSAQASEESFVLRDKSYENSSRKKSNPLHESENHKKLSSSSSTVRAVQKTKNESGESSSNSNALFEISKKLTETHQKLEEITEKFEESETLCSELKRKVEESELEKNLLRQTLSENEKKILEMEEKFRSKGVEIKAAKKQSAVEMTNMIARVELLETENLRIRDKERILKSQNLNENNIRRELEKEHERISKEKETLESEAKKLRHNCEELSKSFEALKQMAQTQLSQAGELYKAKVFESREAKSKLKEKETALSSAELNFNNCKADLKTQTELKEQFQSKAEALEAESAVS